MKQLDFYNTLSKKNKVLFFYKKLILKHNKGELFSLNKEVLVNNKSANICLFPSYIQPVMNTDNDFKVIKISQKKIIGYSVLINNHTSIDALLKTEYKKSFRSNILRFVNRFENCFDANYKMFFEHISKKEYNFLMDTLHQMLTKRFNQRNDSNQFLQDWSNYLDTTYTQIKEKKASLFVIYNGTTPVHICVNHHFNKILFVSIPSFDLDYSKFALGNISLYKLLEWCVNNNYMVMDMAYGYLEYKRRWSNHIYDFDHHIIFNSKSLISHLISFAEIKKIRAKNFLKTKNFDEKVKKIKNMLRKNSVFNEIAYKLEPCQISNNTHLNQIDLDTPSYQKLKKPVFDFLFSNKEHINNISIYEITKGKEYLLKTEQCTQKLSIV